MGVREVTKIAKIAKVRLGDVAVVSAGQGAPQGDSAFIPSGGIPFVRAGHLVDLVSGLSESQLPGISEDVAKKYRLKLQRRGTVLFAKSGMSCMKGLVYRLKTDCYVVSHLATVKTDNDITDHYLEFYFQKHKPNLLIKDPAYPSLSLSDISQIRLALPSLLEQKRIAEELDQICELKKNADERLALMDQLVKSRFVEMFGDVDLDIRGFNIVKIEDVCSDNFWIMPATPEYVEDGEVRYITSKNIKGGVLDFTDCKRISREAYGTISRKRPIQLGDFLISMIGTLGEAAVVTAVDGEFYGQNMFLLRPDVRKVDSVYLMSYLMHSTHVRRAIERSKNSSTQAYLKREHVIEMKIPLPPLALQREFAAFVAEVDKSKFVLRETVARMETLYKAKLQEYFG